MQKILIVEDEEHILMALEDDFKLEGYQVSHTKNHSIFENKQNIVDLL